jgi:glycosyltransferase involved in cell wall biosynthesis
VLKTADEVITITPFYVRRFEQLGQRTVTLLTNGFDEDDFRNLRYVKGEKFLIRHVGIVNEKCDPKPFMKAIAELMRANGVLRSKIIIEFVGEVHGEFKDFVFSSPELKDVVRFIGNIPHQELLSRYGESSLLVLILTGYKDAEGFLPGKLFEYLATGLPVLGVGPVQGDAARLMKEANAGKMVDSADRDGIKNAVLEIFDAWNANKQPVVKKNPAVRYSRRGITEDLVKLL